VSSTLETVTAQATPLPDRLSFLDDRAKARAADAVRAFETHTSAELVITAKKEARRYPEVDLAFGALFAFLTLLYLLFSPIEFAVALLPIDVLAGFGFGFALSRLVPPIRRLAISRSKQRAAVDEAAMAAFVRLGVSRTSGRTGVLVFVALFERMVAVVPDTGVSEEAARAADEARTALEAALACSNVRAFAETIEALGPRFGRTMQRSADDVNELPDEVA
jgi:putative membrane protein